MKYTRLVGILLCALLTPSAIQPRNSQRLVNPSTSFPIALSVTSVILISAGILSGMSWKAKGPRKKKLTYSAAIAVCLFIFCGSITVGEWASLSNKHETNDSLQKSFSIAANPSEKNKSFQDSWLSTNNTNPPLNQTNTDEHQIVACQINQDICKAHYYHGLSDTDLNTFLNNVRKNYPWLWQHIINFANHHESGSEVAQKAIKNIDSKAISQLVEIPRECQEAKKGSLFMKDRRGFERLDVPYSPIPDNPTDDPRDPVTI